MFRLRIIQLAPQSDFWNWENFTKDGRRSSPGTWNVKEGHPNISSLIDACNPWQLSFPILYECGPNNPQSDTLMVHYFDSGMIPNKNTGSEAKKSINECIESTVEVESNISSASESVASVIPSTSSAAKLPEAASLTWDIGAVGSDGAVIPTKLTNLQVKTPRSDSRVRKASSEYHDGEISLGSTYTLVTQDVICGHRLFSLPGGPSSHPGNERLRVLVDMCLDRYCGTTNRLEKSDIIKEIVEIVRSYGGNFVKQESNGVWYDVGNRKARDKVGHAMRAAIIHRNRNIVETVRSSHSSPAGSQSQASLDGLYTSLPLQGSDTTDSDLYEPARIFNESDLSHVRVESSMPSSGTDGSEDDRKVSSSFRVTKPGPDKASPDL